MGDEIQISGAPIRLGQLLKLANLIDQGSDAKALLAAGEVSVNGDIDNRRGRKLVVGDIVSVRGSSVTIIS